MIFLKGSQQSINIMLIENMAYKTMFQIMFLFLFCEERGAKKEREGMEGKGVMKGRERKGREEREREGEGRGGEKRKHTVVASILSL